ncbi:MAG: class I SAM-dependent methyltransferase [Dehalococcoidia bacterium]
MANTLPPLRSFDRVAHLYDATRGFPPEAEAAIAAGLRALLPSGAPHLLEVGIGSGRVAAPLAATGVRITGIDISAKMLALLRAKAPQVDALFAESAHLPFRNASFDAALFVHILHLVPDPVATVRDTLRCVRPGGVLFACETKVQPNTITPAREHIRAVAAEVTGSALPPRSQHDGRHTGAFQDVLAEHGVTIEDVTLARWLSHDSGQLQLDETLGKVHSHTWGIPDELLPVIVERARPEVERICGSLDRVYQVESRFRALIARLP